MGGKARTPAVSVPDPVTLVEATVQDIAALKRLAERLDTKVDQVDNSRAYAGSAMVYYCKLCDHWAATLPESHWDVPKHCTACKELLDASDASGLTPTTLCELAKDYRKEPAA